VILNKMTLKNVKPELNSALKSLEVYASARELIIVQAKYIVKACRESINASHSANAAIPGNESDMLLKAQEKTEKAGQILKRLQKRMKSDYGRFWRQDLNEFFINSEQEVVEAFSLLAVVKREEIPPTKIHFQILNPETYRMTNTSIRVSYVAYIYGLLDCVGELKRVIIDSVNRADSAFAKDVFKIMQEMFNKLEEFTQFSNSFSFSNRRNYSDPESGSKHQSDLKQKIDVARYAVNNARKLLG